jgi:hypothetical protein
MSQMPIGQQYQILLMLEAARRMSEHLADDVREGLKIESDATPAVLAFNQGAVSTLEYQDATLELLINLMKQAHMCPEPPDDVETEQLIERIVNYVGTL